MTLLVGGGGAPPPVVPIAAESGAGWVDKPPLLALVTPGLGAIPKGVGATFPGVVRVRGQAQGTDWEALVGCAGLKSLVLGGGMVRRRRGRETTRALYR